MALSLGDILDQNLALQPKPTVTSARSRNRAAAWSYDLAKWREYRLGFATTSLERKNIEAEYQALLEDGPDFTGYHASSDFAEPARNDITREDRNKILAAFDQVRAWLYRNARKPRGQAVSRLYREVLSVVLSFALKFKQAYPSHATIAKLACCSERTVVHALAWLRLWGFLDWKRRLKRVPSRFGARTRQTSNAYSIASGLASIGAAVFFSASDRNKCRPSQLNRLVARLRGLQTPKIFSFR